MELTVKSYTPFAKRRTKGAPLLPAAHPRRYAALKAWWSIGPSYRNIKGGSYACTPFF
jgi:hypothetical protein